MLKVGWFRTAMAPVVIRVSSMGTVALCSILATGFAGAGQADTPRDAYVNFQSVFESNAAFAVGEAQSRLIANVSLGNYDPQPVDYCQPVFSIELEQTDIRGNFQWDATAGVRSVIGISDRRVYPMDGFIKEDSVRLTRMMFNPFEELMFNNSDTFFTNSADGMPTYFFTFSEADPTALTAAIDRYLEACRGL